MNNLSSLQEKVREEFWKVLPYLGSQIAQDDGEKLMKFIDSFLAQAYDLGRKDFRALRFEARQQ